MLYACCSATKWRLRYDWPRQSKDTTITVPTGVKHFNYLPRAQPRVPWAMELLKKKPTGVKHLAPPLLRRIPPPNSHSAASCSVVSYPCEDFASMYMYLALCVSCVPQPRGRKIYSIKMHTNHGQQLPFKRQMSIREFFDEHARPPPPPSKHNTRLTDFGENTWLPR